MDFTRNFFINLHRPHTRGNILCRVLAEPRGLSNAQDFISSPVGILTNKLRQSMGRDLGLRSALGKGGLGIRACYSAYGPKFTGPLMKS